MIGIALLGGLGALCRYGLDALVSSRFPHAPWGTVAVNVVGCFLIGLATAIPAPAALSLGFFGGFTTFSTAMMDVVRLAREERHTQALADLLGMFGASFLALITGMSLAEALG